jgi:hypothetical protein
MNKFGGTSGFKDVQSAVNPKEKVKGAIKISGFIRGNKKSQ